MCSRNRSRCLTVQLVLRFQEFTSAGDFLPTFAGRRNYENLSLLSADTQHDLVATTSTLSISLSPSKPSYSSCHGHPTPSPAGLASPRIFSTFRSPNPDCSTTLSFTTSECKSKKVRYTEWSERGGRERCPERSSRGRAPVE